MALRALTAGEVSDYVPGFEVAHMATLSGEEAEAYKDEAAVFVLRVLNATEAARLDSLLMSVTNPMGSIAMNRFGDAVLWALRCGLVGWRNVRIDGSPVAFVGRRDGNGSVVGADDADVDRLPGGVRLDLFEEIKRRATVTIRDFR